MIGPFRVERQLGSGGMGVVYLAVAPNGRRVAVKVIRSEYAADPDFRERFAREVTAARAVSGAYTAAVLDADTESARPWLATEFVDAPTLSARVKERGALPAEEVWHLAYGLAEALRDIHRAGVVHRDLKPANVLMGPSGPLVIDFGISRSPEQSTLTTTGRMVGTPPFMSPEQFQTPRDTGPSADLFALGCVLTYASTGHGPFDADEPYAAAFNVVFKDPELGGVPNELLPLVEWCLEKRPADRPSPDQVLEFLRDPQSRTLSQARRPARKPRRRALFTTLAAAALAAVVVAGSLLWTDPKPHAHAAGTNPPHPGASAPRTPLVEPADALQPQGWATWERAGVDLGLLSGKEEGYTEQNCSPVAKLILCAVSRRPAATETSLLIAVDPVDGHRRWEIPAPRNQQWGAVTGSPDGNLVAVVHPGNLGGAPATGTWVSAVGLDARTGAVRWRSASYPSRSDDAAPDVVDADEVLLPLGDRYLALDVSGSVPKPLWSRNYPTGTLMWAVPGAPDLLGDTADSPSLLRLDPRTGKVRWRARLPRDSRFSAQSVALTGSTAVVPTGVANGANAVWQLRGYAVVDLATGTVTLRKPSQPLDGVPYAGSGFLVTTRMDGKVSALDLATGAVAWSRFLGDTIVNTLVSGDRVYYLSATAKITCLSLTDGTLLWTSAARQPTTGMTANMDTFLLPADGLVIASSARASFFALKPPF